MKPNFTPDDARQLDPLNMAFIGDTVWEAFVRDQIFPQLMRRPASALHQECVRYVRADAQSDALEAILPLLSEEETTIFKRGRNQKSGHVPRNAILSDYKRATGFEALLGFLYLTGQQARLEAIMDKAFAALDGGKEADRHTNQKSNE